MSRISKIVVAFSIVVLISILFDMKVSSAATKELFPTPPTEGIGSIVINPLNIPTNSYLSNGKGFISATGKKVNVSGNTRSYSAVGKITVNLYLQRWDPTRGIWITVINIGGYTNSNSSFVSGGKKANVSSGYYYRTRAHHRVSHNGKVEQAYSNTSSIYIK